ncbi:MAG: FtsW/RodA/SpoVE family cell cycle protein [Planctomycetes bacterium]|nr:FtsW/RodA/SpoVE family cell cycle protein [Planctomycetota bacterium]
MASPALVDDAPRPDGGLPLEEIERSAFLLLTCVLTLLAFGVVMVFSAAAIETAELGGSPWRPLLAHGAKVAIGLTLLIVVSRQPPTRLLRFAKPFYFLSLLLLALVLVPGIGVESNGSQRWMNTETLIGFALQPSEIAKLALVLAIAAYVAKVDDLGASFTRTFLPAAAMVVAPAALILLETDFGTSLLLSVLGFLLLMLAGARVRHLLLLAATAGPIGALFLWLNPDTQYIFRRLGAFADHHFGEAAVASGLPTQVDFAESALRVGGLTGVGIGAGRHKLFFLAEGENDFILANIGEELGFIGTTSVLLLFALLLWSGRRVLLGLRHRFGFFVVAGVLLTIAIQALMNVFVAVRWAPVKGIPLPFVSSGGSSLTLLCLGVGAALACARRPRATELELGPEEESVAMPDERPVVRAAEGVGAASAVAGSGGEADEELALDEWRQGAGANP